MNVPNPHLPSEGEHIHTLDCTDGTVECADYQESVAFQQWFHNLKDRRNNRHMDEPDFDEAVWQYILTDRAKAIEEARREAPRMLKVGDHSTTATGQHLAGYKGLHDFAATLTKRARELDEKEHRYEIMPQQSTEILGSMIENYVYAVLNIMHEQELARLQAGERGKVGP